MHFRGIRQISLTPLALLLMLLVVPAAFAETEWHIGLSMQQGTPTGWVRVREFDLQGDRLAFQDDLNVHHVETVKFSWWRNIDADSAMYFALSGTRLTGDAVFDHRILFNGTLIEAGEIDTVTKFTNFLRLDAEYRHQLVSFDNGGTLWGGIGLAYVRLYFRLQGTIAASSEHHETKEAFSSQALPVPTLGLHFRYPITQNLTILFDAVGGHLPEINTHINEGGYVRMTQTNTDLRLGLRYRVARSWQVAVYGYSRHFMQEERSNEDGNFFHMRDQGFGLGIVYTFD